MVVFKMSVDDTTTQGLGLTHAELQTLLEGGTVDVKQDFISGTPAMVLVAGSSNDEVKDRIDTAIDLAGVVDGFRELLDNPVS